MVATTLAVTVVTTTLAAAMITTTLTASVVAATSATMSAAAAATALLHTATCGQFGTGSRISLHIVGIVTQLADFLTQLVRIGFLRIVINGQLRRLHVVAVGFHTLEIRHILLEFVGTLLADAVGLDRHGLLVLRGRLLGTRTQRDKAH